MQRLKRSQYFGYGVAGLGKVAVEVTLQLYLFDFYTRILGLSPLLAGAAFAVAILWDAVSDVVLAFLLFRARHRGIAYTTAMMAGAAALGAATILLFSPWANESGTLFLHLLVAYVLVNTGMTLLDLPQTTLSAELTREAAGRNKLLASRMGFGILGLAVASVLPGLFLEIGAEGASPEALRASRTNAAWALAAIVLVSGALTWVSIRRAEPPPPDDGIPSPKDLRSVLRDRPFLRILAAGVVAGVGRTINAALALLYYRLVLNLSEAEVTRAVLPLFTFCIILSIPLWVQLARIYGKRRPAYTAIAGLGIMGIVAYPTLPENLLWPVLLVSVIGGVLSGAVFLVDSMITDLIDRDEATTGTRKEALYFAVWKSALKFTRAAAFVMIGVGLQIAGLDQGTGAADAGARFGLVFFFGIVVGLCFLASGLFLRKAVIPAKGNEANA